MSSVSKGPANTEFEPFDLSKMTAREVAAELVRRSHPISTDAMSPDAPDQSEPIGQDASPEIPPQTVAAPEQQPASNQEIVEPLPSFLRDGEELAKSVDWDWPPESAEPGVRDPLDVLSRALHTHLQERELQQRAAADEEQARIDSGADIAASSALPEAAIVPDPEWVADSAEPLLSTSSYTHEAPLIPSSVMTTGPAAEVLTSLPSATRLSGSLDIPVQPSSIGRPADSALPASLSPGSFARSSTASSKVAAVAASDVTAGDRNEAAARPAIRHIRASDRATERAKVLARLWLASASAQASSCAARLHLGRKNGASVSDPAVIDDSDPIVPGSMISESLVPDKASESSKLHIFQNARAAASRLAAIRVPRRRLEWRAVHWEAVAGGVLLGVALTIGPALYFLMAPGHAPALTVMTPAAQFSSAEPSLVGMPGETPATGAAATEASATTDPVSDTAAASTSQPAVAPAPPAIVPPDPAMPDPDALVTAAGGTSASSTSASGTLANNMPAGSAAATNTGIVTSAAATSPATAAPDKTPPIKPVSQKVSSKKVKPKPGTVSAHQATKAAIDQLSPAKR